MPTVLASASGGWDTAQSPRRLNKRSCCQGDYRGHWAAWILPGARRVMGRTASRPLISSLVPLVHPCAAGQQSLTDVLDTHSCCPRRRASADEGAIGKDSVPRIAAGGGQVDVLRCVQGEWKVVRTAGEVGVDNVARPRACSRSTSVARAARLVALRPIGRSASSATALRAKDGIHRVLSELQHARCAVRLLESPRHC